MTVCLAILVIVYAAISAAVHLDAWPFSCYPMFSGSYAAEKLKICRIAFENAHGVHWWWNPHYYKFQLNLSTRMMRCFRDRSNSTVVLNRLLTSILPIILQDTGAATAESLCVVMRTCVHGGNGKWQTVDEIVHRVSLSSLAP